MKEIGILARGGRHTYHVEAELGAQKLNFRKFGGLKLTELAHIKDIICIFRVKHN